MNFKNSLFLLILFNLGAQAAPVCPFLFLSTLPDVESHLQFQDNGDSDVEVSSFNEVNSQIQKDPTLVNCQEDLTFLTPLIYSLDLSVNPCTLPDTAQYLLDHGANATQKDAYRGVSPLLLATEAYGTLFGTPDPIELKDESCAQNHTEEKLRKIISTLVRKGADPLEKGPNGKSAVELANDLNVSQLFKN